MKEFDEIDHMFQDTFHEFEMTPDPSIKQLIDAQIAQPKRKKRFLIWFFPLVLAFGALGYVGYINTIGNNSKKNNSSNKKLAENLKEKKSKDSLTANMNNSVQIESKLDKKRIYNQSKEDKLNTITSSTMSKGKVSGSQNNSIYRNKLNHLKSSPSPKQRIPIQQKGDDETIVVEPIIPDLQNPRNEDLSETKDLKNGTDDSLMMELPKDTTKTQVLDPKTNTIVPQVPNPKKSWLAAHWAIAGVAGFETGKGSTLIPNSMEGNQNQKYEFANVELNAFYGKLEATKVLDSRFYLLLGIGYKYVQISQTGTVFTKDSLVEASSLVPTTYFYDKKEGKQDFKINSVLVPIGLTYHILDRKNFFVQTSLIGEMSFGKSRQSSNLDFLAKPEFNKFGFQASLRPEFHYRMKKSSLFVFGSVGKTFQNHLNWDFADKKPWLFGGGVGWRYGF